VWDRACFAALRKLVQAPRHTVHRVGFLLTYCIVVQQCMYTIQRPNRPYLPILTVPRRPRDRRVQIQDALGASLKHERPRVSRPLEPPLTLPSSYRGALQAASCSPVQLRLRTKLGP
jgi:hypothetical protein